MHVSLENLLEDPHRFTGTRLTTSGILIIDKRNEETWFLVSEINQIDAPARRVYIDISKRAEAYLARLLGSQNFDIVAKLSLSFALTELSGESKLYLVAPALIEGMASQDKRGSGIQLQDLGFAKLERHDIEYHFTVSESDFGIVHFNNDIVTTAVAEIEAESGHFLNREVRVKGILVGFKDKAYIVSSLTDKKTFNPTLLIDDDHFYQSIHQELVNTTFLAGVFYEYALESELEGVIAKKSSTIILSQVRTCSMKDRLFIRHWTAEKSFYSPQ